MVPIQSIKRALDVLDALTLQGIKGQGMSLQAVAAHLGVASPTAHNILKTMVACGYVARDAANLYRLGPRCEDLTRGAQFLDGLLEAARRVVHGFAETTGESVVLATLVQGRRYALLRADGQALIRVSSVFEETGPFYDKVTARVLAAYASPAELALIVQLHGLPGADWEGIATEEELAAMLARVRAAGYSEQSGDDTGVYALAVPVLSPAGKLVAALGTYLPVFRTEPDKLAPLRTAIVAAARRIGSYRCSTGVDAAQA